MPEKETRAARSKKPKENRKERKKRLDAAAKKKKAKMQDAMRKHKACVPRRVCINPETGEVRVVLGKDCPVEFAEAYTESVPKKGIRFSYKDEDASMEADE
jgi:carotenoid cleavage dioxygenase-like enzyme